MTMTFSLKTDEKHEVVIGNLEVEFTTPDGKPCAGVRYQLELSDGTSRTGALTQDGKLKESGLAPGITATVRLIGVPLISLVDE
ncbi:MAG: hypothetical protein ACYTFT_04995 [Planctomycetota bacterium]|jgi:hypothetical protein